MASVFGLKRLLLSPAAPDIGRYVRNGSVTGVGVEKPVSIAERFSDSGLASDIPDVTSREVMSDVARSFLEGRDRLPVCSRGFAVALAEQLFPGRLRVTPAVDEPILIAIGSRDDVTARQRKALCETGRFVCLEAPEGRVPEMVPAASRLLLFCAGTMQAQAESVARTFAEGVCRVVAALEPRTLLCSGGDTALAFLRSVGQTGLEIFGEVAPGLPISVAKIAGRHVDFISKSGGFGGASTLLDVFTEKPTRAGFGLAQA
jgi:uncharacterized protein YgbK (DUF1537 family)